MRVWAVHSLSCESCKDGPNPIDAVPLLLERIELDESINVRRQAVAMLAHHRTPDPRVLPVFKRVMANEDDRKLRLHANHGLKRYAEVPAPQGNPGAQDQRPRTHWSTSGYWLDVSRPAMV